MCGIAGVFGNIHQHDLQQALQLQRHRGPDNTGTWHDDQAWLGHNRLSIIDLSTEANQPMHSACGRYVIIFNGEIYNYPELADKYLKGRKLHSASDTEVLLEAFAIKGKDILSELNGMFAFAIWDKQEKTLFAARDRFGVKPLHYAQQHGSLYLASEIKTLWKLGIERTPDPATWVGYFLHGTNGKPDESFWAHIRQLPGGHWMQWRSLDGQITIKRWYDFAESVARLQNTDANLRMEEYKALLLQSIRYRFRSDVPVGLAVSGGLDSSLLLSAVKNLYGEQGNFEAYTFYCNYPSYDEVPWVEKLVANTSIHLNKVLLTPDEVPQLTLDMSTHQDEPFGGFPTIAYGKVFAAARSQGTIVLLDGQGMDEAWAGYDYYHNQSGFMVQGSTSAPTCAAALNAEFATEALSLSFEQPFDNRLQNLQYRDLFYTKIPRALRYNDRASMKSSVELREPFLDYRLVELGFSMPESFKVQQGVSKYELRKLATAWMGTELSLAPKRPVQTPQREWLRHELRDWASSHIDWLCGAGNPGWFDTQGMQQAWQNFIDGRSDNSNYVWQWINAACLLQQR